MNGREGKCGGHEYMQKLIAAIDDSELIVFCAPTYVYHIPGQVKTLLDHFAYRWLVHRPDLSLMCKQALIITTAAGGGMKSTVRDLRDSMNYWGVGRTHVITQAVWGYDWSSMPENFMHKIEQKVEKTVSAIQKSAGNVTPCAKVKGLFYMYRLFHKKRKMNPADDEYWYEKGYVSGKPWKRGR
ncbi:MAG: flavodoxin family protein [Butyricicoccus sp.]